MNFKKFLNQNDFCKYYDDEFVEKIKKELHRIIKILESDKNEKELLEEKINIIYNINGQLTNDRFILVNTLFNSDFYKDNKGIKDIPKMFFKFINELNKWFSKQIVFENALRYEVISCNKEIGGYLCIPKGYYKNI